MNFTEDSRTAEMESNAAFGVYKFKDAKMVPDPYLAYNIPCLPQQKLHQDPPAIVIDNGMYPGVFCNMYKW